MDNDKVIGVLNDLIEIAKDGQEGFRQAAEKVKNIELRNYFLSQSQQRARMAGELQDEVQLLGGDPDRQGSVRGALHRTWIDLKDAVGLDSDHAILSSVESGEDAAVKGYESALRDPLPPKIAQIVERQYINIKATHDQVRALRDSTQYQTRTA
ncbi:MAG: PA2169 family four-helix-bundle protein [Acidobacteriota bacterium]